LMVPTLVIGVWPRIAMDFYEAATDALASDLGTHSLVALTTLLPAG